MLCKLSTSARGFLDWWTRENYGWIIGPEVVNLGQTNSLCICTIGNEYAHSQDIVLEITFHVNIHGLDSWKQ